MMTAATTRTPRIVVLHDAELVDALPAAGHDAPVDAVVTDGLMPQLSGYELCRFLRQHPKLTKLPVVLLEDIAAGAYAA